MHFQRQSMGVEAVNQGDVQDDYLSLELWYKYKRFDLLQLDFIIIEF